MTEVCTECFRRLSECGCTAVPIPRRTPAQMLDLLLQRWRTGGAVPELVWLVAMDLRLDLDDVRTERDGAGFRVVVLAELGPSHWRTLDRIGALVPARGIGRVSFVDTPRPRRSVRPRAA